jgi:hypothetical protein
MVRLVIIQARHSAKIRAKSLIVSEKNFINQIIAHLCSEMALFGRKSTFRQAWFIRYSRIKACYSILLKESNYRPDRVSDGSTVNNMLKLWVCRLSFLKRHPSVQKSKTLKHRALLQWKEKNSFRWVHPGSLIDLILGEETSQWKPKYGFELPTSIRIIRVEAVENLVKF